MDTGLYYGLSTILWPRYYIMATVLYYSHGTILWPQDYIMTSVLYYGHGTILWIRYYTTYNNTSTIARTTVVLRAPQQ